MAIVQILLEEGAFIFLNHACILQENSQQTPTKRRRYARAITYYTLTCTYLDKVLNHNFSSLQFSY